MSDEAERERLAKWCEAHAADYQAAWPITNEQSPVKQYRAIARLLRASAWRPISEARAGDMLLIARQVDGVWCRFVSPWWPDKADQGAVYYFQPLPEPPHE